MEYQITRNPIAKGAITMFQCYWPDGPCNCQNCTPRTPQISQPRERYPLLPDRSDLRKLPEVQRQIKALIDQGVPTDRIHVSGEGTGHDCEHPVVTVISEPEREYVQPDDSW